MPQYPFLSGKDPTQDQAPDLHQILNLPLRVTEFARASLVTKDRKA